MPEFDLGEKAMGALQTIGVASFTYSDEDAAAMS